MDWICEKICEIPESPFTRKSVAVRVKCDRASRSLSTRIAGQHLPSYAQVMALSLFHYPPSPQALRLQRYRGHVPTLHIPVSMGFTH